METTSPQWELLGNTPKGGSHSLPTFTSPHPCGCFQGSHPKQTTCLPMEQTQVRSLDQKDPLEKEMEAHFSIFAWTLPWTEEPGGLKSMGMRKESDMT